MNKYKLVKIKYKDITTVETDSFKEFLEFPVATSNTVGWIVKETDDSIYLGQDVPEISKDDIFGIIIPKGCIIEIKELNE